MIIFEKYETLEAVFSVTADIPKEKNYTPSVLKFKKSTEEKNQRRQQFKEKSQQF